MIYIFRIVYKDGHSEEFRKMSEHPMELTMLPEIAQIRIYTSKSTYDYRTLLGTIYNRE